VPKWTDFGNIWNTLRELDVNTIREESERALVIACVGHTAALDQLEPLLRNIHWALSAYPDYKNPDYSKPAPDYLMQYYRDYPPGVERPRPRLDRSTNPPTVRWVYPRPKRRSPDSS